MDSATLLFLPGHGGSAQVCVWGGVWLGIHSSFYCNKLQHSMTNCNTLWQYVTEGVSGYPSFFVLQHIATQYNTLQRTTTHCNSRCEWVSIFSCCCARTLNYTQTQAYMHTHTYTRTHTHTRTYAHTHSHTRIQFPTCNTLQHTATHCNNEAPIFRLQTVSER